MGPRVCCLVKSNGGGNPPKWQKADQGPTRSWKVKALPHRQGRFSAESPGLFSLPVGWERWPLKWSLQVSSLTPPSFYSSHPQETTTPFPLGTFFLFLLKLYTVNLKVLN